MRKLQTITLAGSLVLSLAVSPSVQAKASPKAFNGKTCTIVGTNKSEKLTGTSKPDVICGLGGNDTINGAGGNDTIDGGNGNDKISGGTGNDQVAGVSGNDLLGGGNGNDTLLGGNGNDNQVGGNGNDSMLGGNGNDNQVGGNGNDSMLGGNGNDTLNGGAGKDVYDGGAGLNECYVEEIELRDFTCSLLPNLSYLLKRVTGKVVSPGINLDGCAIFLFRYNKTGSATVKAPIYKDGNFQFDAPAGDYYWNISADENSTCKSKFLFGIWASHQVVSDNTPYITFTVPRLTKTRVYVRNSLGTPLKGALLYLATDGSYGSAEKDFCSIPVTNMCGYFNWSVDDASSPQPRTNSLGYYEVFLPEGVRLKARAEATFAGITMESNTLQDVVLTYPNANIDLVIE